MQIIRLRAFCVAILSLALIGEGSVGNAAAGTRVPIVAAASGTGTTVTATPQTLAAALAQMRATTAARRAQAVREADAFMKGSDAYRRAHTLRVIKATRSVHGQRGTSSLPMGNNGCVLIGDGGLRFGGPNWICWFNDVGATVNLDSESSPSGGMPIWGTDGYYCPSSTTFYSNNSRASMQVVENPTVTGTPGSCNRIDGPVTSTFTRQSSSTDFNNVEVQVLSEFTVCLRDFGNNCVTADFDTMYVNLSVGTPWAQSTALPERACGRCNGTSIGKPIDVATGELWNEQTDMALSGPFGLSFTRFYGSQTAGSGDLGGTHWLHTYSSRLDVSGLGSGAVTYIDSEGMPYYFTSMAAGASSYDNLTGMTLSLSADATTYSLAAFDGMTSTFNAKGELSKRLDRVGNAQIVSRDPVVGHNDRILDVADPLGRRLCFFYDASNRITAVAAWMELTPCPSAVPARSKRNPVLAFAYDTGTNCATGGLCTATDADGKLWAYEYAVADPTYPGNLTKVLDPQGHVEESNTYSRNLAVHQESGNCTVSPCAQTGSAITITYPTDGTGAVQIVDGLGRPSTLHFSPLTMLITSVSGPICRCGGDQTRYWTYDDSGRVVTQSDDGSDGSFKHTITYHYDRDSARNVYPGATRVDELLDTQGPVRRTTLAYYPIGDPRQDLVQTMTLPSVDSPGQNVTTVDTYSTAGLLTQRTATGLVNGLSTAYTWQRSYDARGRLQTQTGPRTDVPQITRYAYFADNDGDSARAGQLQSVTDPLGHVSTLASAAGFTSYDPYGHPQSMSDPNGVVTDFTHDAVGRVLSSTLMPVSAGDATLVVGNTYDASGRLTQRILPAGNRTKFGYDTSGRLTHVVREDAVPAAHERMLIMYDASDQQTTIAAQSCPAPAAACTGWSTTSHQSYSYSSATATLTQIVNADGTAKTVTFTPQGALATLADENHNYTGATPTRFSYDLAGRRLSSWTLVGGRAGYAAVTRYAYDLHDNVVSVTDPNFNVTTYHYDDFDRMTNETSPVTGVTTYAYDADGNVTMKTNANGTMAAYTYDALDRMLTEADTKGTAFASEAWTYDDSTPGHFGIGRLATMTDPSGSTAYTYDRRGNVVVENHNVAGSAFTYGYGYDANGNRSIVNYPDGTTVLYTFDFADRPYSAQQEMPVGVPGVLLSSGRHARSIADLRAKGLPAPNHAAKSELPLHPTYIPHPTTKALPNRVTALPRRGAQPPAKGPGGALPSSGRGAPPPSSARGAQPPSNGRSIALPNSVARRASTVAPSTSVLVASATYAPFGPVTSIAFGNGTTQTLTYDQRYLPRENKLVAGATTLADYTYLNDAAGNIQSVNDELDPGYNRFFTYDDLNRLRGANSGPKLWGSSSTNGYTYDAMGNILTVQLGTARAAAFTYLQGAGGSNLPLVATVVENSATTRNVMYDAIGSEVSDDVNTMAYGARELLGSAGPNLSAYGYDGFRRRVQAQTGAGQQRVSLYDGDNRVLAETVASAAPASMAYEYVWFGDRPVAQFDATATHWSFADHLGTPLIQTDAAATVTWQAEYEPFGQVYALRRGDVHQPLRLPGQEAQQFDTGANGVNELSYNGARWYRAGWGRYTQSDPIGLSGGVNPYAYAADQPDVVIDPSGLCFIQVYYHQIEELGKLSAMANHGILRVTDNDGGSTSKMYDAEPSNGAQLLNYGVLKPSRFDWYGNNPQREIRGAIYRTAAHFQDRGPLTVVNDRLPCNCYAKRLDATTNALKAAHMEYDPLAIDPWSGNSNSALYEWLKSIDAASKPTDGGHHPWIPGYHAVL